MRENGKSKTVSTRRPAIVVGVDGSTGAREALRWALAEGRLRNSPVRVVHAWTVGYIGAGVDGYGAWSGALGAYTSLGTDLNDLHRAAEDLLEQAIAEVGEESEGVEIERLVVQGTPSEVLVHAAAPSDLLVVGSRGHGGFLGLMLGSVSQQCVHHARCPVVVVHGKAPAAGHAAGGGAEAARGQSTGQAEEARRAAIDHAPEVSA